jgi:hypothetical protein
MNAGAERHFRVVMFGESKFQTFHAAAIYHG